MPGQKNARFRFMPQFPENRREWRRWLLFVIAFVVPVQTLLPFKTFRAVEAILLVMAASNLWNHPKVGLPRLLFCAFWLGFGGFLLSTIFSRNPLLSADTGILEFLLPFACLSLFLSENREFLQRLITVFLFSALLLGVAQMTSILALAPGKLHLPILASEFLMFKKNVPLMVEAGKAGYGNTDNYASLWVLLVPAVAGYFFLVRHKWLIALGLFVIIYSGLLVYSRSGIVAILVGLLALVIMRLVIWRRLSPEIVVTCIAIVAIHVSPGFGGYLSTGAKSLVELADSKFRSQDASSTRRDSGQSAGGHMTSSAADESVSGGDWSKSGEDSSKSGEDRSASRQDKSASGTYKPLSAADGSASGRDKRASDRATTEEDRSAKMRVEAWETSLKLGNDRWLSGIGYGSYPAADPVNTAPHSMLLLRYAEGGILSVFSFILLVIYAPLQLMTMLFVRKRADMFALVCYVAVSTFMLKAVVFGASFAISSNIVWGFGVALLMAGGIVSLAEHAEAGRSRRHSDRNAEFDTFPTRGLS
jgi:hypothetical protein